MKKTIVITDVTQMPKGNEVCVVGIDVDGRCIRPVCEEGFLKQYLRDTKQTVIVRHGAKVEFDFHKVDVVPPHIEDQGFDPDSIVSKGFCNDAEWESILQNSSYTKVGDIFDNLLQDHSWVKLGAKTRSIATLSQVTLTNVQLPEWNGKLRYRLSFRDSIGSIFDRPISDLAFRELCYKEIKRDGHNRLTISAELTNLLTSAERVYLRLGLARPWAQPGSTEKRCYLQVTGIYTFPDYLQGRTFADFLPQ